jgi:trehalose synthase
MLQTVDVPPKSLESYEPIVGSETSEALRVGARPLRALRVAHISSTVYGGDVAELLHSLVPLYRSIGVAAELSLLRSLTGTVGVAAPAVRGKR